MKRTEVLQEIRKMRFEEIYALRTEKRISVENAANLLGVNERTFRRWVNRYEDEGVGGLVDGRLEKAAHNAAGVDEVIELLLLFETRYTNFSVAHFYDKYRSAHGGTRCYTWVKNKLQDAGYAQKSKKTWNAPSKKTAAADERYDASPGWVNP